MTAIVGIIDGATVWLGGDSANTTDDHQLMLQAQSKVFKRGQFAIGGCGNIPWCEWLFALRPPRTAGMQWLRAAVAASSMNHEQDGALVGWDGRLWEIDSGGIYRLAGDFACTGDGGATAWGALWATKRAGIGPRRRLRLALEAAESRCSTVRRPFRYVHT